MEIHDAFPENVECLSYLVALCRDLGRNYQEYENKLVKLERNQAYQTQALQTQQDNRGQYQQASNHGDQLAVAYEDAEVSMGSSSTHERSGNVGSSNDKYAAPDFGFSPQHHQNRENDATDDDDFADADIDGLLTD